MSAGAGITAGELAELVGGRVEGDAGRIVAGVAPLANAGPSDLAWLQDPDYVRQLAQSRAGGVLVRTGIEARDEGKTLIFVPDADLALCAVLARIGPRPVVVAPGVHAQATVAADAVVEGASIGPHVFVGAGARVGRGTQLHAGVYVGEAAEIGSDCVLWPNVVVRERCRLGDRVVLHANSTIGADGFGYLQRDGRHVKIPQVGIVVIEDDVEIGANSAVDRARSGETRVGRGTKIDNLVQVGHNVSIGSDCIVVAQCGISGSTTLGHHVVLAGQVGLVDHIRIGDGVMVTAQSGVTRNVEAGKVFRGSPAEESAVYLRQLVAVRKLPRLAEQVRELSRRIERLESAADHPEGK